MINTPRKKLLVGMTAPLEFFIIALIPLILVISIMLILLLLARPGYEGGEVKGGGVVLIGPIPIIFKGGTKAVIVAVTLAILLLAIMLGWVIA